MEKLGLSELSDRILLEPGGWGVLVVDEARIGSVARELAEELTFALEQEGAGSVRIFGRLPDDLPLLDEIGGLGEGDIALLPLGAARIEPVTRLLDYGRARLAKGPKGLIVTSEEGVLSIAVGAPNLWSWIGPRVWGLDPGAGHLDVEARLGSLREGTGLQDTDVIERGEAGTLPADPVFAEWLVLLGRGDLLER